jgi:hypothetical protein
VTRASSEATTAIASLDTVTASTALTTSEPRKLVFSVVSSANAMAMTASAQIINVHVLIFTRSLLCDGALVWDTVQHAIHQGSSDFRREVRFIFENIFVWRVERVVLYLCPFECVSFVLRLNHIVSLVFSLKQMLYGTGGPQIWKNFGEKYCSEISIYCARSIHNILITDPTALICSIVEQIVQTLVTRAGTR